MRIQSISAGLLLLLCLPLAGWGQVSTTLPSTVLDLRNWKITLPVNTAHSGNPDEILQPELAGFLDTNFFYVNLPGNGVVFTAPCGGATTGGSSYPRSELREMTNNGAAQASWSTSSGTHIMEITQAITHLPVVKPDCVAGQIHNAADDVITFRLEGTKLFVEQNGADGPVLTSDYQLGTVFTVKWIARNGGIESYYNGQYIYTYPISTSGCYFKAGCYTQSNPDRGDSPTAYGEVVIYSLSVSHSPAVSGADVGVLMTGPQSVAPGAAFNYIVTLTNLGPDTASNVVLRDNLPAAVNFVSAGGGGVFNNGVVTWPAVALLGTGSWVSYSLSVTAPLSGQFTNIASATSATADPNSANNDGSAPASRVVTTIPAPAQADVIAACSGPATVSSGGSFNYIISVTNLGPDAASNVVVRDNLPAAVTFVSASGGGVFNAGVVTWPTVASLATGAAVSYTLNVTAPVSGLFTNVASATSGITDPNSANNDGSAPASRVVTTTLAAAQADVIAACSGPAIVLPGVAFSYTISITNLGPDTASNVVVRDDLPAAVTFVSASGGGVFNSGVVTWPTVASLATGAAVSYTLNVTAPVSGLFTNVASATSGTTDPNSANNDGSAPGSRVVTTVLAPAQADVIAACSGPATVLPGAAFSYTISITNLGPDTASNVVVRDDLPAAVSFVSASGGGVLNSGAVTWPVITSLAPGGQASFTVNVAAPGLEIAFTNSVSASSSTPDPISANNDGTSPGGRVITSSSVLPVQFDISVATNGLNFQTGLIEVSVTVTNTGPGDAGAVRLFVYDLRAGLRLYNAAGTNGGYPYVRYNFPLSQGASVRCLLEFYVPDRSPFTATYSAVSVPPLNLAVDSAGSLPMLRVLTDLASPGAPRYIVEFNTVPRQDYTIIYSDDGMSTWTAAMPSLTASASVTQWYDDGPPQTVAKPVSATSRQYRVLPRRITP